MNEKLKLPFVASSFDRLTSIRLTRHNDSDSVVLNVDDEDRLDGTIWENDTAVQKVIATTLSPGAADIMFTLRTPSNPSPEDAGPAQALIVIAMPVWKPDCCAPMMLSLGSFCPLDVTDEKGMDPQNRRLFWDPPANNVNPPVTRLDFTVSHAGLLTWKHFASTHTVDLAGDGKGGKAENAVHLAVMTRGKDTAEIVIPKFGNLASSIVLKL